MEHVMTGRYHGDGDRNNFNPSIRNQPLSTQLTSPINFTNFNIPSPSTSVADLQEEVDIKNTIRIFSYCFG